MTTATFSAPARIVKADATRQLAYGVVLPIRDSATLPLALRIPSTLLNRIDGATSVLFRRVAGLAEILKVGRDVWPPIAHRNDVINTTPVPAIQTLRLSLPQGENVSTCDAARDASTSGHPIGIDSGVDGLHEHRVGCPPLGGFGVACAALLWTLGGVPLALASPVSLSLLGSRGVASVPFTRDLFRTALSAPLAIVGVDLGAVGLDVGRVTRRLIAAVHLVPAAPPLLLSRALVFRGGHWRSIAGAA